MSPLVEVTQNLTTGVLPTCLVVVHDAGGGGQNNDTERTGGQQLLHPLLDTAQGNVEAGRDDAALVDTSHKLDNDLSAAVVIDELVFANVA